MGFGRYTYVSSEWQDYFEKFTFRRLLIDNCQLARFFKMTMGEKAVRLSYIRYICLRIKLQDYDDTECDKPESHATINWNNQRFTHSLKVLFDVLRRWKPSSDRDTGLILEITAYLPGHNRQFLEASMDYAVHENFQLKEDLANSPSVTGFIHAKDARDQRAPGKDWLMQMNLGSSKRLHGTPLELTTGKNLKEVPIVHTLWIRHQFKRGIKSSSLARILRMALTKVTSFRLETTQDPDFSDLNNLIPQLPHNIRHLSFDIFPRTICHILSINAMSELETYLAEEALAEKARHLVSLCPPPACISITGIYMLLVMLISQRDSAQHIRPAQPDQAAYFSSSLPLTSERQIITLERNIMLTGFEALGAASAVLQVISFATDVIVACKNAYDGATTSQDDLQRYAGQMSEAIGRVHTRCEYMRNANSKFASPKLQDIAKQCKEAAKKLEAEVQYVTGLQAKGDLVKSLRKAFRASRHQKKIQALHESLSMYQQVVITEITSHLCSQSDAIYMQQDVSFGKLDIDVQFLISQLAQGITGVENLVKQEHTATRNIIVKESARAEVAINSHMDKQALELRTASETKKKCEVFLQSLKAPLMNHRYNDIMDSTEASFNQVFASYEDMKTMYHYDSESDGSATDDQEAENLEDDDSPDEDASGDDGNGSDSDHDSLVEDIHQSWASLNTWLQSTDKLFYIRGKPGSGKSTLIKFIGQQEQTNKLLQRWNPDATILSYFFWKIGSEEQKSLKGLWCSLLHQRLEDQQQLIPSILQNFNILSRHSQHHDWAMKDLQIVWNYLADVDIRHLCIFIDGLDEIRNEDGFSELLETIDAMLVNPKIKICVSTRPEASIVRWLKTKKAAGILLEDLTRYDMLVFVQKRFHKLSSDIQVSSETIRHLRHKLVDKALGVFLWLHLATRSIIEGIENVDSEDMLISRLNALPGNLENLYIDMWQRMNAKSPVYAETARRYFRYVLQHPERIIFIFTSQRWYRISQPWILQFTCAENPEILEKLLKRANMMDLAEILQRCEDTKASIQSRCAGLLEVRQNKGAYLRLFKRLGDNSNAFAQTQKRVKAFWDMDH
ncbi:Uncharacterized protein Y057_7798 [Fusarium fujikuroi]|nr:Uncharacterized protein Y057_7798 [Fusarium fujikuroi]